MCSTVRNRIINSNCICIIDSFAWSSLGWVTRRARIAIAGQGQNRLREKQLILCGLHVYFLYAPWDFYSITRLIGINAQHIEHVKM